MNRLFALLFILGTLFTVTLSAQVSNQHNDGNILCGSELMTPADPAAALANTARINPAAYRRIMQRASTKASPRIMSVGETNSFTVFNQETFSYDDITAILVSEGQRSRVWLDVQDTARIKTTSTVLAGLEQGLESATPTGSRNPNQGIIQNDLEVYGSIPHPANATDDKIDFLLTDIKDGITDGSGFVAGFFSPTDQSNPSQNPFSNGINLLYVDNKQAFSGSSALIISRLLGTMAHEFQHLIHYNMNKSSEKFPNEGCSEEASILNGYVDRNNSAFLKAANVSLFRWSSTSGGDATSVLQDYARAMTFHQYMREQFGEGFLTKFAGTKTTKAQRYTDALKAIGRTEDFSYALKGFVTANYLQSNTYGNGRFRYLQSLGAFPTAGFSGNYTSATLPMAKTDTVESYAARYYVISQPGGLRFTFTSNGTAVVMAILYKGTAVDTIRELPVDGTTGYTLGSWYAYDKIVLITTNLTASSKTIGWTAEKVTLGVDDKHQATTGLSVSVTPNPVLSNGTITYSVPATGRTSLELYNTQGKLMRTMMEEQHMEPGTHTIPFATQDMSAGHYILILRQGAYRVTQSLLITQ